MKSGILQRFTSDPEPAISAQADRATAASALRSCRRASKAGGGEAAGAKVCRFPLLLAQNAV